MDEHFSWDVRSDGSLGLQSDGVGLVYFNRQICPVLNEYIDNSSEE